MVAGESGRESQKNLPANSSVTDDFVVLKTGRPPQPPKRDPKTTLSVGRARARSMVIGLTEMGKTLIQFIQHINR